MSIYTLAFHTTHDAGAALLEDRKIVAAATEERFSRIKHFASLPYNSIQYCLDEAGIDPNDVDQIVIPYDIVTEDVNLLLARDDGPETSSSMPKYARIVEFPEDIPLETVHHHEAHAASAYYTCGFDEALVVTADGFGDGVSTTVWHGKEGDMEELLRVGKEGSLGWFYGIVTQALGWWVQNGEGKTMGLSSYGDATPELVERLRRHCPEYEDGDLTNTADIGDADAWHVKDTLHPDWEEAEFVEDLIDTYDREDVAAAAQELLEEQILDIVGYWIDEIDVRNVALSGGVFLNVAVNREIIYQLDVDDFYAFPAAGDAGLPLGAALKVIHNDTSNYDPIRFEHPDIGPGYAENEVQRILDRRKLTYERPGSITDTVAELLLDGLCVAWFQGRMEYGPRALGNRSILIDPQLEDAKDRVNSQVKFRDSWRPFAPSILHSAIDEYLVEPIPDPFMITSYDVREEKRTEIPSVTHVDGTTRPQVVKRDITPVYHELIDTFDRNGGVPLVLNTSFNLSGDPIVCSPQDAIETFYNSGLDALAIEQYVLRK